MNILVIGGGAMGSTIALAAAWGGETVTVLCRTKSSVRRCEERLSMERRLLEAGGVSVEWATRITVLYGGFPTNADVVIEAASEELRVKRGIIAEVQRSLPRSSLWSTTSALPASELAAEAPRPGHIIVAHFANPAHLMPLVEVVPSPGTEPAVTQQCMSMLQAWGKRPVLLRKESRGFVLNRLQYALLREALSLVAKGVVSPDDLEAVVTQGYGLRLPVIGPLGTVNVAGAGIYATISDWIWPDLDNAARSDLLHTLADSGELFMGWSAEATAAAGQRVRGELIRRIVESAGGSGG